ncbi:MAG: hypothetical protein WCK67_09280 [bacterium]
MNNIHITKLATNIFFGSSKLNDNQPEEEKSQISHISSSMSDFYDSFHKKEKLPLSENIKDKITAKTYQILSDILLKILAKEKTNSENIKYIENISLTFNNESNNLKETAKSEY